MVTMVLEAARDQVPVTIDGKKRKISKAQAAAINLANAAATGNPKFVLQFIDLIAGIEARAEAARHFLHTLSAKSIRRLFMKSTNVCGHMGR